ncbi:unnamed protein product [Mytilus coruscus]|uniref:Uncharacterized protein n=1 Tax=Mytilus coruscus TaxID=42192 RepID=A0A6J8AYT0_MYTCO|nr:unnamed protein product [Mytilus coruscus]
MEKLIMESLFGRNIMATEYQRLIALSLGKIAASRQKRGGINLHKNLLVASVLHKARSAYMMENLQTMLAKKAQQNSESKIGLSNQQISNQNSSVSNTSSLQSSTHNSLAVKRSRLETDYRVNRPCQEDKENAPPKCSKLDNENVSDNPLCDKTTEKCELTYTHHNGHVLSESQCTDSNEVNDYVSNCSRCASKRRHDHDQSQTEDDHDVIVIKKRRLECDEKLSDFNEDSEDMQTDCAQMTTLVNVFNTSLGGLCAEMSRTSNDDADDEADDEDSDEENDEVFYTNLNTTKSISGYHGLSDKGNIYCGSNVVDSVTMPTPIALTV